MTVITKEQRIRRSVQDIEKVFDDASDSILIEALSLDSSDVAEVRKQRSEDSMVRVFEYLANDPTEPAVSANIEVDLLAIESPSVSQGSTNEAIARVLRALLERR